MKTALRPLFAFAALLAATAPARAADVPVYHIGVDARSTIQGGTYNGLTNPNANRLTLLWSDDLSKEPGGVLSDSHFHSIGTLTYSGPANSPTVVSGTNYRIPQYYEPVQTLDLTWDGARYASGSGGNHHYEPIRWASINSLMGAGPGVLETYLLYSGGYGDGPAPDPALGLAPGNRRWTAPITGSDLALELVSATPGLHVGLAPGSDLFAGDPDKIVDIGAGESLLFSPSFWTDAGSAGEYRAEFRLLDRNDTGTNFADSGVFEFRFQVAAVPEPSAWAALGAGALAFGGLAARRRRR